MKLSKSPIFIFLEAGISGLFFSIIIAPLIHDLNKGFVIGLIIGFVLRLAIEIIYYQRHKK